MHGSATSTFQGSINLIDGCFAIGGVCVEGIAPSSYVGLTDTPGTLLAGALQFATADMSELTQSLDLVFIDGRLGIGLGTSTPTSTLSVVGDAEISEDLVVGDDLSVGGVLSVLGSATSTFAGGVNVLSGCVAVNGECLISGIDELAGLQDVSLANLVDGDFLRYSGGMWQNASTSVLGLGDGTYIGLSDTPEEIFANAIQFGSSSGTTLSQSTNFVFTDTGRLGIGTSTPSSVLTVVGDASIAGIVDAASDLLVGGLLNVAGGATSTFQGSINLIDGCFAIEGECIVTGVDQLALLDDVSLAGLASDDLLLYNGSQWENVPAASLGLGDGTFRGLTDTPNTYIAGAIPFATSTEDGLTQSGSFIFDGSRLGVATSDLRTALTVGGGLSLLDNGTLRLYNMSNTEYLGLRAPSGVGTTTVWTLPETDGTLNQLLVTDGSGNLSFADVSSIGDGATVYLDLLDTPSFFATSSLVFVNSDGDGLTQSEELTFSSDGLLVNAEVLFLNSIDEVGFNYIRTGGGRLGLGAAPFTDDRLSVRGSITQVGGTEDSRYRLDEAGAIKLPTPLINANANDVAIVGNYAFVGTNFQGDDFHVVDITDPNNPSQVASIQMDDTVFAVTVQGRYAYLGLGAGGTGFHVVDTT